MSLMRIDGEGLGAEYCAQLPEWSQRALAALVRLQTKTCRASESTGWYHWPRQGGFALARDIHTLVAEYPLAYDMVVVVGIGGSFAGCRAVDQALRHSYQELQEASSLTTPKTRPILYAGHNLSEEQLIELLDILPQRQIVLTVISKSGATTETSVAYRILRSYMGQHYGGDEARQRTIIITDQHEGCLRQQAQDEQITSFVLPRDIGGRYSLLTAVGLVPLALAGHNIDQLLQGADELFTSLETSRGVEHPVVQLAATRRVAWDQGKRLDLLAYANPKLPGFVEWWKQLFAESEGKEGKGLFPVGMAYSTDLHSLGQYVQEGWSGMIETFLFFRHDIPAQSSLVERRLRVPGFSRLNDGVSYLEGRLLEELSDGAMLAAYQAHVARGVPCIKLHFPRLDTYTLGYMIALFEVVCALSADLLEVNPFDQPGVEAYKKRMFSLFAKP